MGTQGCQYHYEDFVHIYIKESYWDIVETGDELYISYGRYFWLYEPFWNELSVADKAEVEKLYNIDPTKDLIKA